MTQEFQDKVVLITGAASGIGRATALKLASLGAHLSICDTNTPALTALTSLLPASTHAQTTDVSNASQVASCVASTIRHFSTLDFVFNCAGINPTSLALEQTPDEYFDALINTNLRGTFLVTRACAPHLRRGSAIVNVSSICGLRGVAQQSVYCATKFGVIGLTKSLALELGPRGVRVNAVAPGYIDTPTNAGNVEGGEAVERMRLGNALERVGTPEEVADVVVFLMGGGAGYMNGSVVEVDGGLRVR